ncbi:MAG TPA: DNA translocase FtsK 4TM domain-containing protein [Gemmatimonadaceae bacterium]|nr:DNA translocase FtsK 4TM domain-containing protein [Gemmatimonadaceae bacterium]
MSPSTATGRSSRSEPGAASSDGEEVFSRSDEVRREVAAIALLLFAIFIGGALAVHGFGLLNASPDGQADLRGSFGSLGEALARPVTTLFGWPAAVLIPVALAAHAMTLFGRLDRGTDRSWLVFLFGMVVLLPVAFGFTLGGAAEQSALSGMWGGFAAYYLLRAAGNAGAWIIWLLALSALMAGTLSWNPVRLLVGRRARPLAPDDSETVAAVPHMRRGSKAAAAEVSATSVARALEPAPEEMPALDLGLLNDSPEIEPQSAPIPDRPPRERKPKQPPAPARGGGAAAATTAPFLFRSEADDELPPPELIAALPARNADIGKRELDAMGVQLMEALRTFKVEGELIGRTTGPVVTQFEVAPAAGVKVRQIANLANDLALAMRAASIRIVAPIPGRGAVGVEVPNPTAEMVGFRELLDHKDFQTARAALPMILGKDLEGHPVIADLAKMPHLLIAGATGSGKSVCVNTLITSLIYRHTPQTLRFLLVDPKMVELSVYNVLPHLRHKVVTENRDAAAVLKWAVLEMEDRYQLLAANGARNIQDFNRKVQDGAKLSKPKRADVAFENLEYTGGILPYIVLVIDELADLMMTVQGEVERPLAMLAQKARAIGIHLILATQRPSVNVITGLIKANFPSRIAFRVASQVDSRTILDGIGAESLLGNGDMLFIPPGKAEPSRIQGAFISNEDTERLTSWFDEKNRVRKEALMSGSVATEEDILEFVRQREVAEQGGAEGEDEAEGDRDKLFREAAETVIQHQQGSTSLLQRRLKVGYGRAARIIDQLHAAGVLGPPDGSRPRDVLMGLEELDRIVGPRQ